MVFQVEGFSCSTRPVQTFLSSCVSVTINRFRVINGSESAGLWFCVSVDWLSAVRCLLANSVAFPIGKHPLIDDDVDDDMLQIELSLTREYDEDSAGLSVHFIKVFSWI